MSNIRVAFDRYLELQSAKRHAGMLRWCLDSIVLDSTAMDTQKQKSMLLPINPKLSYSSNFIGRRIFALWKRRFSIASCKYYNSNYDIMIRRDTSWDEIIGIADQKLATFSSSHDHTKTSKTKYDFAVKVRTLFDWFYSYNLYGYCYKTLLLIPNPKFCWFTQAHVRKLLHVIDEHGSSDEIFELYKSFPSLQSVSVLTVIKNLRNDSILGPLIVMLESNNAETSLEVLDKLLCNPESKSEPGTFMITIVLSNVLQKFCTDDQKGVLIKRIIQSDLPKAFYSGLIVHTMYDYTLKSNGVSGALNWMKCIVNSPGVTYKDKDRLIFFALKHGNKNIIYSIKLWSDMFPEVSLNYESIPSEILIMKNRWLFCQTLDFSQLDDASLDEDELSRLVSILIYGHTLWGSKEEALRLYFYKESHILKLETSDKIGKLKCLVRLERYSQALGFLDDCVKEDPVFMSTESYDSMFLSLAKMRKWDRLKDQFDFLYNQEQITTIKEYSVLFMSLASRGATKHILDLWDTFTKRGYKPNEMILSSIIFGFIRTKSYSKALQWFSAYSYYHVPLGLKSYGLMLNALASTNDFVSCFRLLDEMSAKNLKLTSLQMRPLLKCCALLGDFKGVTKILKKYFRMFDIVVTNSDLRWINWSHYNGNRFGTVIQDYYRRLKMHSTIEYKDTLLALESASKCADPLKFWNLWNRLDKIHGVMKIDAYIIYMNCYIRCFGLSDIEHELDQIQEVAKCKCLPIKIFNEMIFSCIRKGLPEYTSYILKIALDRGCKPSSKTYSLLLQSNCSSYEYSEKHIDETLQLLNEVLLNRRKDKLGKLDRDLTPMSFKLVIMHVLKFKGVVTARKYFELYVENSKNYLLDDIHILNIELMLLGEEGRWEEFSGCYDRYIALLKNKLKYARLHSNSTIYGSRIKRFGYPPCSSINEVPMRTSHSPSLRISSFLKKAIFTVWPYRLRQLEYMEQLDDVNSDIKSLYNDGFIFSNDNLNETALLMSKHYDLIGDAVLFINDYLLPYHLKKIQHGRSKMKYRLEKIPYKKSPSIYIKEDVFFQIMDNFDSALSTRLTPAQKDALLDSVTFSDSINILQSLRKVISSRKRMNMLTKFSNKIRGRFYNIRHHTLIGWKRYDTKSFMLNILDRRIKYRSKESYLKERRKEIIRNLIKENDTSKRSLLLSKKEKIREELRDLNRKRKSILNDIRKENSGSRKYNVGNFNLYKLSPTPTDIVNPVKKTTTEESKS